MSLPGFPFDQCGDLKCKRWIQVALTFAPLTPQLWALFSSVRRAGILLPPASFMSAYLGLPRSSALRHVTLSLTNLPVGERIGALISAIISDSNYLQIHRSEEVYCGHSGLTTVLKIGLLSGQWPQLLRIKTRAIWRRAAVLLHLCGVTEFARCAPLLRFGRLKDWTALSPERPYLVR